MMAGKRLHLTMMKMGGGKHLIPRARLNWTMNLPAIRVTTIVTPLRVITCAVGTVKLRLVAWVMKMITPGTGCVLNANLNTLRRCVVDKCEHNDNYKCVQCWADEMKRALPDIDKAWND
jgi:hypothetical protein